MPGDGTYETAVELGAALAQAGFSVTNGGYSGLMEAVSKGAAEAGGSVIGVVAHGLFPGRIGANEYVTDIIETSSLTERIHHLTTLADGAVVLPGSVGTLTELIVTWNDASIAPLRQATPGPVAAFRDPWEPIVGPIEASLGVEPGLIRYVDDAQEAAAFMRSEVSDACN